MAEGYNFDADIIEEEMRQDAEKRRSYLQKVASGRSVTRVNPNQEAFSDMAEKARQIKALDKANAIDTDETEPDASGYDFTDVPDGGYDFSEIVPPKAVSGPSSPMPEVRKPFHPGRMLDYVAQPLDVTMGETSAAEDLLGKPPKEYTGSDPIAMVGYGLAEIGHNIAEQTLNLIHTPLSFVGIGMPKPVVPRVLSPSELSNLVAERRNGMAAYPDSLHDVSTPSYIGGVHTEKSPYPKVPKPYTVQEGEFGKVTPESTITKEGEEQVVTSALSDEERKLRSGMFKNPETGRYPQPQPLGKAAEGQMEMFAPAEKAEKPKTILQPGDQTDIFHATHQEAFTPAELRAMTDRPETNARIPLSKKYPDLDIPDEFNVGNTQDGGVFPSVYDRWFRDAMSASEKVGPTGVQMAKLFNKAVGTGTWQHASEMREVEAGLDQIFGVNGWWKRKGVALRELYAGENAAMHGSKRRWNMTQAEYESIFNTLDSEWQVPPINDKVAAAAKLIYEKATHPASADLRASGVMVENPFTGELEEPGSTSAFLPHRPIRPITAQAINENHWKIIYERAGGEAKTKMSFEKFRDTLIALSKNDPEVSSFKLKNAQWKRLLDFGSIPGKSRFEVARDMGYDTDFFRLAYVFNRMGHLKSRFTEIEPGVNQLIAMSGEGKPWLQSVAQRAFLNHDHLDVKPWVAKGLQGAMNIVHLTTPQSGIIGNMAQFAYPSARGGAFATAKGLMNIVTGTDRELVANSGVMTPAVLSEMINPQGPLARWTGLAFKGFGIPKIDRATRWFAGHVGNAYIKGLENTLLKNPSSKATAGLIDELGGNARVVLERGGIPDEMRYEMIQNFANNTAGVTDVRGLPLYATNEHKVFKLVNQYRSFAQANFAEINRIVTDAPNWKIAIERFSKLMLGAEATGFALNQFREFVSDTLGAEDKKRNKTWLRHGLENLAIGLGALPGMMLVQAANTDPYQFMLGAIGGPAAGRLTAWIQDYQATLKDGLGWRTVDTASRSIPLPLAPTFIAPYVKGQVRREAKRTGQRKALLNEGEED